MVASCLTGVGVYNGGASYRFILEVLVATDSLSEQMQNPPALDAEQLASAGPFVAISREYGCGGFSLGLLLLDLLNDDAMETGDSWQIYHKELLENLAKDTGMAMELIERRQSEKGGLMSGFFKALAGNKTGEPSGMELRKRMTSLIRDLSVDGYAILVGQSAAVATHDLPGGMAIRLEAPVEWRVKQIAFREGLTETKARIRMNEETEKRIYLQKIYGRKYPRKPEFHLTFDCSVFTLSQIAILCHRAIKLRGII